MFTSLVGTRCAVVLPHGLWKAASGTSNTIDENSAYPIGGCSFSTTLPYMIQVSFKRIVGVVYGAVIYTNGLYFSGWQSIPYSDGGAWMDYSLLNYSGNLYGIRSNVSFRWFCIAYVP